MMRILCDASVALNGVEILCGDFADAVADAGHGWFIYFDPPYRPISETSAFCDYTQGGFDDAEQRRLAELCHALDAKGAHWLLSNSEAQDSFFDDLYRRFFGVDLSADYLSIGVRRFGEVETAEFQAKAFHLIADLRNMPPQSVGEEVDGSYGESLFFE